MKNTNKLFLAASVVIMLVVFLLDMANAQFNTGTSLNVPFVSSENTQPNTKSIMQNSEKDIVFIENLGQIRDTKGNKRPDVLFLTRSQCVDMYITSSGITYVFRKTEGDINARDKATDTMPKSDGRQVKTSLYRLDMEFVGMNKNIKIKKELAVEQQFNYYTPEYTNGISPRAYKKITVENIYDGIDLVYYEKEGKMKYDFIVKAGVNADKIKMKYKGAGNVYIDKDGSVIVTTLMGEIREEKPYTYSRNTGKEIESGYEVVDNVVKFEIVEYNKNEDIIIDPYRIWATYYGGNSNDFGNSICTDNSGNLYVTGKTYSTNFPTQTLPGSYNQITLGGSSDVFILKFNSSGARLWATYYGGQNYDWGNSICTDNSGNLYVTGKTGCYNFPTQTLPGAYNQTYYANGDAFILKFNSSGARLWATCYGGHSHDEVYVICTDNSDNLYVTGRTESYNFPTQTLAGAYNKNTHGGGYNDAFILKFNSSGARLWATYYGGSSNDYGYCICADNSGNLYITGRTNSTNFPTQFLTGAYNQATSGGGWDTFILKFNSSGARLWATYYGGSDGDWGNDICTDNSGNLYITGRTSSTNFPTQTLPGAYNQTTHGGDYDAFILKFNSSSVRLWATYYGGNDDDLGWSICTDNSGALYVTGITGGYFPTQTLPGAYNQTTLGGNEDAFILKFNSSGARLWATYYGGSSNDYGYGICADNSGNLYVTGGTQSNNFPTQTLAGAYNQTTSGGSMDAFILKFGMPPLPSAPILMSPANNSTGLQLSLNLVWLKPQYAVSYRIQLSTDSLFNNLIINDSTLTDTIKALSGLTPLTYYWWRVNAKNLAGTSPYSSAWKFRTLGCPTQVNLIYPSNDTTNIPVNINFKWNKAIDQTDAMRIFKSSIIDNRTISKYWFELTTDTAGTPLIIDSTLTDTTKSVSSLNNLASYYWRVKAKNEIGWGVFSSWYKFTTIISAPLAPVLISPVNGATLVATNPLLNWDSSATAESYSVQVSTDSSFTSTVYDSSGITITQFQIPNNGLNINTTYYWRVNASNVGGTSPYSTIFHFTTGATNISGNNEIPKEFKLYNNYPNPFNPVTKIKFDIPKSALVKIVIYNVLGKEIKTLVNEKLGAGRYEVNWPAPTGNASSYSSGVYFYRLSAGDFVDVKKMMLIK